MNNKSNSTEINSILSLIDGLTLEEQEELLERMEALAGTRPKVTIGLVTLDQLKKLRHYLCLQQSNTPIDKVNDRMYYSGQIGLLNDLIRENQND